MIMLSPQAGGQLLVPTTILLPSNDNLGLKDSSRMEEFAINTFFDLPVVLGLLLYVDDRSMRTTY